MLCPAGDAGAVAGGEEIASFFVRDQVPHAGNVGGDDGHASRHSLQHRLGLTDAPAGRPELVEARQDLIEVAAVAEKMDFVGDLDLITEANEPVAIRSVAEYEQMDVVADHFQEIGRPNGVLAAAVALHSR